MPAQVRRQPLAVKDKRPHDGLASTDYAGREATIPTVFRADNGIGIHISGHISGHISRIYTLQFQKPLKTLHFRASSRGSSSPTQYVFFCLTDISEPRALPIGQCLGNRLGSGSLREPRRTGADNSPLLPLRYNCRRRAATARSRRVHRLAVRHRLKLVQDARTLGTARRPADAHEPMSNDNYILGTLSSGESVPLLLADRRRHLYLCGKTGTGKTGLFLNLMHADLLDGAGFCFLDPHGDASLAIAAATPRKRLEHVIYLDPSDPTHTFAYNPLAGVAAADRATSAANIVSAFKNIWADSWGPRLNHVLSNTLRLLLDNKDQSLIGIPRLYFDDQFRRQLMRNCTDPVIRFYWQHEFEALDPRLRAETLSPIQNKIGILLSNPFIRSVL